MTVNQHSPDRWEFGCIELEQCENITATDEWFLTLAILICRDRNMDD